MGYYNVVTVTNAGAQSNNDGDTGVSLPIMASGQTSAALSYTATGLPSGLGINASSGVISGNINWNDDAGSVYSVTVTAQDSAGYSGSATFNWTVGYYNVLTVTNPGAQSNNDGDTGINLPIVASGQTSAALTYTATGLPSGLGIDANSGVISGNINWNDDAGSVYSVTVTAQDSAGYSGSATFNWTVSYYNVLTVTNPGAQSNNDGDTGINLPIVAGGQTSAALTYTATGLPSGLGIDANSGVISGNINWTADPGSPYNVTVTASDGSGYSGSASFTWYVSYYDQVSLSSPGNQSNYDGDTVTLQLGAGDKTGVPLSFSASNLPPGLSIDPNGGLISGTISSTADTGSPYTVTVTAADTHGYSASQTFTWTVNYPVVITSPGNQSNYDDDAVKSVHQCQRATGAVLSYTAVNCLRA